MVLGTLAAIWRYPAKSLAGDALDHVYVDTAGIPGDRASQLVVADGHARVGKAYRGKENNRLHLTHDIQTAIATAAERGVRVEQVDAEEHYFDAAPISILFDIWLEGISDHLGFPIEHERYRPNFFVRTADGVTGDEASFVGATLRLGEVELHVRKPILRCVTTTYDPHTGESNPDVLRYVAQERGNTMGIYCDVIRPGITRLGDPLVSR